MSLTNISLCFPEFSDKQRRQLTMASLIETGKSITEMGPAWFYPAEKLLNKITGFENREILEWAIAKQQGIIFMTPHLGCWEIAGLYMANRLPLTSLYRPPRIQNLENLITQARQRTGAKLVPTTTSGVKALFAALAKTETIGILPDQDPGDDGGIFAPFFGHDANTMKLIPKLAHKTGVPVILVVAKRKPFGQGYIMSYHKADEKIYSSDLLEAATAMNLSIENCVRENPKQYQWSYKRFKRQPKGKSSLYT